MPKYHVVAAERWGIRASYVVDAPSVDEAVRKVNDQEIEVETYSVVWEDRVEVDEILSVESETEQFTVDRFNRPAEETVPRTESQSRALQQLAHEALEIQDECSLCDVAQSFAQLCVELKNWPHQTGDFRQKRDAIVKLWISKIEHLTGLDQSMTQADYDNVYELARSS